MPTCLSCNYQAEDYSDLADHIIKKKHRKGRMWAIRYRLKTKQLDRKQDLKPRAVMTEEEKENHRENRKSCLRELTGQKKMVVSYCPYCKKSHHQPLPVEYLQSPHAWHTGGGVIVAACGDH